MSYQNLCLLSIHFIFLFFLPRTNFQYKAVIDKTFPFGMDNDNVAGKGYGLMCCCAEDGISVMDGV
jgi:hypothetical protein